MRRFFGRKNKDEEPAATRANLGEAQSSMYFDKEKGRWRERGKEHEEVEEEALKPPPMMGAKTEEKKEEPEKKADDMGVGGMTMAPPNPYGNRFAKKAPAAGAPAAPLGAFGAPPPAIGQGFGAAQPAAAALNPNAPRGFGGAAAVPMNPHAPGARRQPPAAVMARGNPFGAPAPTLTGDQIKADQPEEPEAAAGPEEEDEPAPQEAEDGEVEEDQPETAAPPVSLRTRASPFGGMPPVLAAAPVSYEAVDAEGEAAQEEDGFDEPETPEAGGFAEPEAGGFDEPEACGFDEPEAGGFDEPEAGGFDEPEAGGFDEPEAGGFAEAFDTADVVEEDGEIVEDGELMEDGEEGEVLEEAPLEEPAGLELEGFSAEAEEPPRPHEYDFDDFGTFGTGGSMGSAAQDEAAAPAEAVAEFAEEGEVQEEFPEEAAGAPEEFAEPPEEGEEGEVAGEEREVQDELPEEPEADAAAPAAPPQQASQGSGAWGDFDFDDFDSPRPKAEPEAVAAEPEHTREAEEQDVLAELAEAADAPGEAAASPRENGESTSSWVVLSEEQRGEAAAAEVEAEAHAEAAESEPTEAPERAESEPTEAPTEPPQMSENGEAPATFEPSSAEMDELFAEADAFGAAAEATAPQPAAFEPALLQPKVFEVDDFSTSKWPATEAEQPEPVPAAAAPAAAAPAQSGDEVAASAASAALEQELRALREEHEALKARCSSQEDDLSKLSNLNAELETQFRVERERSTLSTDAQAAEAAQDAEAARAQAVAAAQAARAEAAAERELREKAEAGLVEAEERRRELAAQLEASEERSREAESRLAARSSEGGPAAASPTRPSDNEEFDLPDCVWSCGNSELIAYVQKLAEENASMKQAADGKGEDGVKEVPTSPLAASLFDTLEVNQGRAMAFAENVGEGDGHQIQPLMEMLKEHLDKVEVCAQVCTALENLTFTDSENRRTIVRNGGMEALLKVLKQHEDASPAQLRPCVDTLWNITFEDEAVDAATEANAVDFIAAVMRRHQGAPEVQGGACAVLLNLAVREENRWKMARGDVVSLVVGAMQKHAVNDEVLEQGCQALYMLAYHQDLRPLVVAAKGGDAAVLAASRTCGAGRAQKWGRWLQEVLAC